MASILVALIPLLTGLMSALYLRKELVRADVANNSHSDTLRRGYVWQEVLQYLLWCPICVILFYSWHFLLRRIAAAVVPSATPNATVISANWSIWLVSALLLTIVTSFPLLIMISRVVFGPRYEEYLATSFERALHNPRVRHYVRYSWQLILGITMFCSGLVFLAANYYVFFESDGVRINRFWSIRETRYAYSQITDVANIAKTIAPNGSIRARPHIAVRFVNGEVWTSLDGWNDPDPTRDRQLIEIIQSKTNLVVNAHDFSPW